MARVRIDLFICMVPAMAISCGLLNITFNYTSALTEHFMASAEASAKASVTIVEGEPGSLATDDIPRVSSLNEILATNGEYFTIEMNNIKYTNSALPINGENYYWTVLTLSDDNSIPMIIYTENNQLDSSTNILTLPTGKIVNESVGSLDAQVEETMLSVNPDMPTNFYIDMGQTACTSPVDSFRILSFIYEFLGVAVVIFTFILTLVFHSIGFKLGLFPPIRSSRIRR